MTEWQKKCLASLTRLVQCDRRKLLSYKQIFIILEHLRTNFNVRWFQPSAQLFSCLQILNDNPSAQPQKEKQKISNIYSNKIPKKYPNYKQFSNLSYIHLWLNNSMLFSENTESTNFTRFWKVSLFLTHIHLHIAN